MAEGYIHSVRFVPSKCKGCVTCVKACPTDAIRVRNGKAELIAARCIDCGECMRRCAYHAVEAYSDKLEEIKKYQYNIVLPPPSLYAQFPADISEETIRGGLSNLGFDEIFDVAVASEYISLEIADYIKNYNGGRKPLISCTCPAVLRLIQVKFPELIKQVVPVLPPVEAAAIYVKKEAMERLGLEESQIGVWFLAPCPSKDANIRQSVDVVHTQLSGSIAISEIYGRLMRSIGSVKESKKITAASSYGMGWGCYGGELAAVGVEKGLAVHGIENVYDVLEQISMNKMPDVDYVECSSCSGGCIGGPLTAENKFVAEKNLKLRLARMREHEPADRVEAMKQSMVCEGFPKSGAYVKKLSDLDYDLPIVNRAIVNYFLHGISPETTIMECSNLRDFQKVVKVSSKYKYALYSPVVTEAKIRDEKGRSKKITRFSGGEVQTDKTFRVFASKDQSKGGIFKVSGKIVKGREKNPEKFGNTPDHCFFINDDVTNLPIPDELDKQYYIDVAWDRLKDFGVER